MSERPMDEHARSLDLVAASLDFPLAPDEQELLRRHLAVCLTCSASARSMRADATTLAGLDRVPAPGRVRMAVVRAASDPAAARGAGVGWRWSAAAAVLAIVVVGGALLAGVLVDRSRRPTPVASRPVTAEVSPSVRPTPIDDASIAPSTDEPTHRPSTRPTDRHSPAPTDRPTPGATDDATAPPTPATGWQDEGIVDAFEGRTISLVLARPGGGLVAIGREAASALPSVWVSDDGIAWMLVEQPESAFGGRVPGAGVLRGDRLWVVGWDVSVEAGGQRAIWSSADGRTWSRVVDGSGLLGTQESDLRIAGGERGLVAWAADGRAWTSRDGATWTRSTVGTTGVTDAAVTDDAWVVVGQDGARAFVVRSTDGRSWSDADRRSAAGARSVGIEVDGQGAVLAWVGAQAFDIADGTWRVRSGAATVPDIDAAEDALGGTGFVVLQGATQDGQQLAATGDGTDAWQAQRSEPTGSGARSTVGGAVMDDAWFVLTRQGTTYRGWILAP